MADLESILSGQTNTSVPENTPSQPAAEPVTASQPDPGTPADDDDPEPQGDLRGMVPVSALRAERSKKKEVAKRYTEQVASFEQRLEQQNAEWERRLTHLFGSMQPQPQQQAPQQPVEAPPVPDIWDDPDAYLQRGVQQAISPVEQQLRSLQRGMAEMQLTREAVAEAEAAFNNAAARGVLDPEVHRRINSSPNPWAAAVQWLNHVRAMSEIGDDPAAFRQRVAEEERQRVLAEMGVDAGQPGRQQVIPPAERPAMPSNFAAGRNAGARSGPGWSGPQSIADIFSTRR
jgi:hypothetical protein